MAQLIIGDIHGCYDELQQLLDKAAISDSDDIIAVGDLFDRGPKPAAVFRFFRNTPNAHAIMGNHEWNHLRATADEIPPRAAALITRWKMDDAYPDLLEYIESLPLYYDLPDAIIVHAFLEPHIALENQRQKMLTGVTSAEQSLLETYEQLWYTYYNGDKPVIVGHRDYSDQQIPFIYQDRVYGIDTRCVYGGSLTAIRLPDFEIISVPARRDHWKKIKRRHGIKTDETH